MSLIATHVDDLKEAHAEGYECVRQRLKEMCPTDNWDDVPYQYVGCDYEKKNGSLYVHQRSYVERRLEDFKIARGRLQGPPETTREENIDNMSSIGGISWLAAQTRPDLACRCSMLQKRQKDPRLADLQKTAGAIREAKSDVNFGLRFQEFDIDDICFVV